MPTNLVLSLEDFKNQNEWRWVLKDSNLSFINDHEVKLDPKDFEYEGFTNLYKWVRTHEDLDNLRGSRWNLTSQVGHWVSEKVLGQLGADILNLGTPAVVRVQLPEAASFLLYRPLELAHVNGIPLALQGVSMIFEIKAARGLKSPVSEQLRILAVFSLPDKTSPLGLRRERYELKKLIKKVRQSKGGSLIDLTILQYGVTRELLAEVLEEGDGWDVVHFSGHGLAGGLLLETKNGQRDLVPTEELIPMLMPAKERLKLVTLSACESAAATINETKRWLGLYEANREVATSDPGTEVKVNGQLAAVGQRITREINCAVLAMRYPVGDDFAIDLALRFYDLLFDKRRSVPDSLQLALKDVWGDGTRAGLTPFAPATPALFGDIAGTLKLIPPPRKTFSVETDVPGLERNFDPEPERFVGRLGPMTRAATAFSYDSSYRAVLFYGMAGAGKTTCALELSYRYERNRFGFYVWHKAPDEVTGEGAEETVNNAGALASFAQSLESQVEGLRLIHLLYDENSLLNFLPKLKQLLERESILIVIDNIESLLTSEGKWRDSRWGLLVSALINHNGSSRLVLTSRRPPNSLLNDPQIKPLILSESIHALSLNESVMLAREWLNLGALLRGEREGISVDEGREMVRKVLEVVQGHPEMIKLAEHLAANPTDLKAHLEKLESRFAGVGPSVPLEDFFNRGESTLEVDHFLSTLDRWTHQMTASLSAEDRALFQFLCCLEEKDRTGYIVETVWPYLRWQLGLGSKPSESPLTSMLDFWKEKEF